MPFKTSRRRPKLSMQLFALRVCASFQPGSNALSTAGGGSLNISLLESYRHRESRRLTFNDTINCLSSRSSLLSALLALSCSMISCRLLARFWRARGGGQGQRTTQHRANAFLTIGKATELA